MGYAREILEVLNYSRKIKNDVMFCQKETKAEEP